jgi:hypothetical protein
MPKNFTWGPVGKKNRRADLRHHVNFVFPATPQVFYWAYIFNIYVRNNKKVATGTVAYTQRENNSRQFLDGYTKI